MIVAVAILTLLVLVLLWITLKLRTAQGKFTEALGRLSNRLDVLEFDRMWNQAKTREKNRAQDG